MSKLYALFDYLLLIMAIENFSNSPVWAALLIAGPIALALEYAFPREPKQSVRVRKWRVW